MSTLKRRIFWGAFLILVAEFVMLSYALENQLQVDERVSRLIHFDPAHILGHILVTMEISSPDAQNTYFRFEDISNSFSSIEICLGAKKENNNMSGGGNKWILTGCVPAESPKVNERKALVSLQKFDVTELPLMPTKLSTHLVVVMTTSDAKQSKYFYWTTVPLMFPNDDVVKRVIFTSEDSTNVLIGATLSLKCVPNNYGPRCAVTCYSPSIRHHCDPVTGELKCVEPWLGKNCDQNVILSKERASQFIKTRSKRANSCGRFEEVLPGNIERECEEEKCSREEAREAFEDDARTAEYWRAYTDPNQCLPNPCNITNHQSCVDLVGDYKCLCKPGYKGKNCQIEIDVCLGNSCKNGATCQKRSPTSYACKCPVGYRGEYCETNIDDCTDSDCGSHGTCIDGVNNFTCQCDAGFTGSNCETEINECASNPCQNGGNCTDHVAFYTCKCPDLYDGENCQNRISPCHSHPCLNGGECFTNSDHTFNCSCTLPFTGPRCQHNVERLCGSQPCANGGTCYVVMNNVTDSISFLDTPQPEQKFHCLCPIGFRGPTCKERISACEIGKNLCPVNATCIDFDQQYLCACEVGYTGDMCQFPGNDSKQLQQMRCQDNPCLNGARCIYHNNETRCICRPGFNGTRCENKADHCSSSPCINGGSCLSTSTGFYCNCAQGFNGTYCEQDIDECSYSETICKNGGTCNNTQGSFRCLCDALHKGRFCEQPYDPCESGPCKHGGSCRITKKKYMCDCLEGYGGHFCEVIIDPCTDVTNPCMNDAACRPNSELPSEATCTCTTGYYGRFCSKQKDNCAVPSNYTAIMNGVAHPQLQERTDCGENGVCLTTDTSFKCACRKGYIGDRCQTVYIPPIVNCTSNNCQCPNSLVNEIHHHENNLTFLLCRHDQYDMGICKKSSCLKPSCSNNPDEYYCHWHLQCLNHHLAKETNSSKSDNSHSCPVIEITLDQRKMKNDLTNEDFCKSVRHLPSNDHGDNNVTIHCVLLEINGDNTSVAVIVENFSSEARALLLASNIFQQLDQELTDRSDRSFEELDPIFSSIIAIKYDGTESHAQNPTDDLGKPTAASRVDIVDTNIIYYVIVALAIFTIIVFIILSIYCVRRRRNRKNFQVTYVSNPNLSFSENETGDRLMVVPTSQLRNSPIKKLNTKDEDFVNLVFVEEQPSCHALTSRPSVHSNPYVATPYATSGSPTFQLKTPTGSPYRRVEEATIDYNVELNAGQRGELPYEDMNGATLSRDVRLAILDTDNNSPYDFAVDVDYPLPQRSRRKNNKSSQRSPVHAYEEVCLKRSSTDKKGYEIVEIDATSLSPTRVQLLGPSTSSDFSEHYNFASEMPSVGVPPAISPTRPTASQKKNPENKRSQSDGDSLSGAPSGSDSGIEMPVSSRRASAGLDQNDLSSPPSPEDEYQSPTSLFPKHDDFFPLTDDEKNDVYSIPRKANPVDAAD